MKYETTPQRLQHVKDPDLLHVQRKDSRKDEK